MINIIAVAVYANCSRSSIAHIYEVFVCVTVVSFTRFARMRRYFKWWWTFIHGDYV